MSRNNPSESIRVAIDVSKAVKCEWCGALDSVCWTTSRYGKIFCCSACKLAFYHKRTRNILILSVLILVLLIISALVSLFSDLAVPVVPPLILLIVISFVYTIPTYYFGGTYARKVPRNALSQYETMEQAMLSCLSAPIECPNCDANLDLSTIGPDMVYHCEHCGATGLVEVTKTDE
jgi:predicted nucleic acid-binding Zn ribbon protein